MSTIELGKPDPENPNEGNVLAYFRVVLHDVNEVHETLGVSFDSEGKSEGHMIAALFDLAQTNEVAKRIIVGAAMELAIHELETLNAKTI